MSIIQSLIKEYSSEKSEGKYQEIVEALKNEESIWIPFCSVIKNYHMTFQDGKSAVNIFSKKEFYDNYEEYMMQQMIQISPLENHKKDRLSFFTDLYRSGFEMLVVDNGQQFIFVDLFDLIKKPDFSNIPEVDRPVMNPALMKMANFFFENLPMKRVDREMETALFKETYNAKYLIAVDASKLNVEKDDNSMKCIIKEDTKLSFPLITNVKNQSYHPAFTDWTELYKFDADRKYRGVIGTFDDLKSFAKQSEGITINPLGVNIILTYDMLETVENTALGKE